MLRLGQTVLEFADGRGAVEIGKAGFADFMNYYQVTLMNPKVLVGVFIGSMMAFLFCGLTMNAVGRAAQKMVEEVRRQFRDIAGILDGNGKPDYARCVAISTKGAQREMLLPSLLAIIIPIVTGVVLGVPGVMGLLVGGLLPVSYWPSLWYLAVPGTMPRNISKRAIWAEKEVMYTKLPLWAIRWVTRSRIRLDRRLTS